MSVDVLTFPNGNTPLDLLLFRTYRREVPGLVEATLRQNPGLAALGPYPPKGTRIRVTTPAPAPTASAAPAGKVIRLYD